jgi:hypothetical protein
MTATAAELHECLSVFVGTIDEAIRLQEAAVGRMKDMAEAVKARDEGALCRILDEAGVTAGQSASAAKARVAATVRLAEAVGCPPGEITLTRLARRVPAEEGAALESRRRRLVALRGDLVRQHRYTAAFLGECARLNRALLLGLLPDTESVKTYGPPGGRHRGPRTGLLDARS